MSKNVYGFEKLDITKVENIIHFYENLELYSENDRIQMLRSITDLVKLTIENNKPEERAKKLQPMLRNIVQIFASFYD
jgi:hypothetical protein